MPVSSCTYYDNEFINKAPKHQTFLKNPIRIHLHFPKHLKEEKKSVLFIIAVLPAHTFLQVPPQTWWTSCAPGTSKTSKTYIIQNNDEM